MPSGRSRLHESLRMRAATDSLTFLFTDIEGSSTLWESDPVAMREALAAHDRLLRRCIESHRGQVVKATGDGFHAAFDDPVEALTAAADIQRALQDLSSPLPLAVRCGLHSGFDESRDGDFFGPDVNRAARIMQAAQGGQILMSQALAERVRHRLPPSCSLEPVGRVRLRGLKQPEVLVQWCGPGLRRSFLPTRNQAQTPHNLPATATRFFGRSRELAALASLLPRERLVLLHGWGGMGKTRLALEAARLQLDTFPDGVWFVELASVTDPAWVPLAVASVLGVPESAGLPPLEAMAAALAEQQVLLVLDNCEQVVDACARLVDELLAAVPSLHVLATSREPLGLTAERRVEVGGLGLPPADPQLGASKLAELDAVGLFEDRVKAAQPAFSLDDSTAPFVARICRQLDGIPLALELAAAATRRMPLPVLAGRLDDRLATLVHGQRTAPARQRTLRALIDWSHDLLVPAERELFRRLSVFAGGWTEAAALSVCGLAADRDGSLMGLGNLVEKSLISMDPLTGRYAMLETVRQYASEQLAAFPADGAEARARHLACYLALAEQARPHLGGPEQAHWLNLLDLERDNLLAAHAGCAETPEGAAADVRLSWALKPYWFNRGLLGLGLRISAEAQARIEPYPNASARATALFDLGQLCFFVGHHDRARDVLQRCLLLCRETGNRLLEAATLQPLGMCHLAVDEVGPAQTCLMAARQLAEEDGHRSFVAYVDNALGQLYRVMGDYDRALACNLSARSAARALGDIDLQAITGLNESMIAIEAGRARDSGTARQLLADAVQLCRQSHSQALVQSALEVATVIACEEQAWAEAQRFWCQAERLARHSGLGRDPADERFLAPRVESLRTAVGDRALQRALQATEVPDPAEASGALLHWLEPD